MEEKVNKELERERTEMIGSDDPTFPELKIRAKELYLAFKPISSISKDLRIGLNTVKSWIYGQGRTPGWQTERDLAKHQALKDLTSDKALKLKETASMTVDLIHGYVMDLKMSREKIDLKTAEKLSSMLTNLGKIIQLDKDESENDKDPETKPSSPEEMRQRLSVDPFAIPQETSEPK